MSHYVTPTGRLYVECDERASGGKRCGRRAFGSRDSAAWELAKARLREAGFEADARTELSLFDLPRGWSVAPYSDDFDHGATRTSLLDGQPIPPIAHLVGVKGDLHTCPVCDRQRVYA